MDNLITLLFLGLRILMGALLYLFLAWGLYTLWGSLKQEGKKLNSQKAPIIRLMFSGNQFPNQEFAKATISIGRSSDCDCVLDHNTISSKHSQLSYHDNQWWISDSGSKNGTFLNEIKINESSIITSKDTARCGKIEFRIDSGPILIKS